MASDADIGPLGSSIAADSGSAHAGIARAAIGNVIVRPLRTLVVIAALTVLISPFVVAIAVSEGVKSEYAAMLSEGGDVYVTTDLYGRNAPIGLDMIQKCRDLQGVTAVVPRVIGRTYAKGAFLAVLGIQADHRPRSLSIVRGRMPKETGDVALGVLAAQYLDLDPGDRFTIERNPSQTLTLSGLFRADYAIWNANLLVMRFDDAVRLFAMGETATDLMLYTRPGYQQIVDVIIRLSESEAQEQAISLRAQTRALIDRYARRGFDIKAGVFSGFYVIALGLGIPCVGMLAGFGLSERRREVGVMKALGWQTREVLEMAAIENLVVALLSLPCIFAAALIWLEALNARGIAGFFIPNLEITAPFAIPWSLWPAPVALAFILTPMLTMVGSTYATWKIAVAPPSEALRN